MTYTLMTATEAEELVSHLNEGDDWTYKAKHDPAHTGLSYVAVYDEDGYFMGRL